jgi:hypothetical protein
MGALCPSRGLSDELGTLCSQEGWDQGQGQGPEGLEQSQLTGKICAPSTCPGPG